MIQRAGTWLEVGLGSYVQDAKGVIWKVVDTRPGWVQLENSRAVRVPMQRPTAETGVVLWELTDRERRDVLARLGAVEIMTEAAPELRHVAPAAEQEAIAARHRLDPVTGRNKARLQAHLEVVHGIYLEPTTTRENVKMLVEAHTMLHDDPTHLMTHPHHHAPKG